MIEGWLCVREVAMKVFTGTALNNTCEVNPYARIFTSCLCAWQSGHFSIQETLAVSIFTVIETHYSDWLILWCRFALSLMARCMIFFTVTSIDLNMISRNILY